MKIRAIIVTVRPLGRAAGQRVLRTNNRIEVEWLRISPRLIILRVVVFVPIRQISFYGDYQKVIETRVDHLMDRKILILVIGPFHCTGARVGNSGWIIGITAVRRYGLHIAQPPIVRFVGLSLKFVEEGQSAGLRSISR